MDVLEFEAVAKQSMSLAEYAARNLAAVYAADGRRSEPAIRDHFRGVRRGADACVIVGAMAIAWAAGAGKEGGQPTQAEYGAFWHTQARQVEREWRLVKQAFPGQDPGSLARVLISDYRARVDRAARNPQFVVSIAAEDFGLGAAAMA